MDRVGSADRGILQVQLRWTSLATALLAACALACACAAPPTPTPVAGRPASPIAAERSAWPIATPRPAASMAPSRAPAGIESLAGLQQVLRSIGTAEPAAAQGLADDLWASLARAQRLPLVLGDQVVFAYKGAADAVHWRGSFNGWSEPGLAGSRVGGTDLWIGLATLPEASRVEYLLVRDGTDPFPDPANPATGYSGLFGTTSVLALPGFTVTDESVARDGVARGDLSASQSIESRHLGYTVDYRVYTPSGYDRLDALPVLYLLDGNDFLDDRMGALPAILDNIIADGRIDPLIAVFIDAREPGDPANNRREDAFIGHPVENARFVADELVPAVDDAYRTDPSPAGRAIAGVSYGGIAATFIVALRPETFHGLAALSPSLWVIDSPQFLSRPELVAGARRMGSTTQAIIDCGQGASPACQPIRIFLSAGLPDWDVGDLSSLAGLLEQRGYAIEFRKVREGHTWDQWRGLSDEMLEFLYGGR
jgi:enterochelin esterase-like enzyme